MITYTDAPERYDYDAARTIVGNVATIVNNERVIRKVEHTDGEWHRDQQRIRYQSGNHVALTEEQFAEWKEYNFLREHPQREQVIHERRTVCVPYSVYDENKMLVATANTLEGNQQVNVKNSCFGAEDLYVFDIHVIGHASAFRWACEVLDMLMDVQLKSEAVIQEHWDQLCNRHKEGVLDGVHSENWSELTDDQKTEARPQVAQRLRDFAKMVSNREWVHQ